VAANGGHQATGALDLDSLVRLVSRLAPESLPVDGICADGLGHGADGAVPQELIKRIVEGRISQVDPLKPSN